MGKTNWFLRGNQCRNLVRCNFMYRVGTRPRLSDQVALWRVVTIEWEPGRGLLTRLPCEERALWSGPLSEAHCTGCYVKSVQCGVGPCSRLTAQVAMWRVGTMEWAPVRGSLHRLPCEEWALWSGPLSEAHCTGCHVKSGHYVLGPCPRLTAQVAMWRVGTMKWAQVWSL